MINNYNIEMIKNNEYEEADDDLTTWDCSGLMFFLDDIIANRWRGNMYIDEFLSSFSENEVDGMAAYLIKTDSMFCDFNTENYKKYVPSVIINYLRDWIVCSLREGEYKIFSSDISYILECVGNECKS